MRTLVLLLIILVNSSTWADIQLLKPRFDEPISLKEMADSAIKDINAAPTREPTYDAGFRLVIDATSYYVKPSMFMAKSRLDEVCHPTDEVLAYTCKEGQRFLKGCHLMFFDAQGKMIGRFTMNVNEKQYPHYCNAMPAMGVANKDKNELLVTMQYFLTDGEGTKKISNLGSDWLRITSLIRLNVINGKLEVAQDDACLGNPNQLDTIAKARKQLQRCAVNQKK
jgi:hypothetical protein